MGTQLTPRQLVEKLDQYVIGQKEAKKALSIALRNRYRRMNLPDNLKDEVVPKNILMIGPTGVGKTELARRLAKLIGSPFIKVEATKFTEVGYVGRDVESMVRDLVETSVRLVKKEKMLDIQDEARKIANQRLVKLIVPEKKKTNQVKNPLEMLFNQQEDSSENEQVDQTVVEKRTKIKEQLANGELEDFIVTIEVEEQPPSM